MSDLAPFIAVFLGENDENRAQFFEKYEQNQALRLEGRKRRSILITGSNKSPIYAQAQMDEDSEPVVDENGQVKPDEMRVTFKSWPTRMPDVAIIRELEIHVGEFIDAGFIRDWGPDQRDHVNYDIQSIIANDGSPAARLVLRSQPHDRSDSMDLVAEVPVSLEQHSLVPTGSFIIPTDQTISDLGFCEKIKFHSVVIRTDSFRTGWNRSMFRPLRESTLLLSLGKGNQERETSEEGADSNIDVATLAPHVASALCSKTIVDLQDENDRLQRLLKQMRTVSITGPGGSPVCAQGQLDEDGYLVDDDEFYQLRIDFPKPSVSASNRVPPAVAIRETANRVPPAVAIRETEIHIGEIVTLKLLQNDMCIPDIVELNTDTRMVSVSFFFVHGKRAAYLYVSVGPIADNDKLRAIANRRSDMLDEEMFDIIFDEGSSMSFSEIDLDLGDSWRVEQFVANESNEG